MRKLLCQLAVYMVALLPAGATTYTVNPSQSQSAIQGVINAASSGDTVLFSAGSYPVTSAYQTKCGVALTGPQVIPATAKISGNASSVMSLFHMGGGCGVNTSLTYFQLDSAGPLEVDGNSYNGITFEYNQVTNLPYNSACNDCGQESVFFDQALNPGNTIQNVTIQYNSFGDANSCTAGANIDSGQCAGVFMSTTNGGNYADFHVNYNTFYHLQEGIHFTVQSFNAGTPVATCDDCEIEYNYFSLIHRIQVEFQIGIANHPFLVRYNVLTTPLDPNVNAGMFAFSLPCCQFMSTFGTVTNTYIDASSNVIFDPTFPFNGPGGAGGISWGFEAWGYGSRYNNNLIQGYVCVGLNWGIVDSASSVSNNTMQGSAMAGGPCPVYGTIPNGGFIGQEFPGTGPSNGGTPPGTMTGNVLGSTPTSITSVAPAISPAPGSYTSPLTVTLTDPGYTSGPQPLSNTSIYYTTDGSTPNPGGASTAAQYYLSPAGNDSNAGTLASPWLTPNHAVNCGDTITAAAGSYSSVNFGAGKWGTVTCSAGNNVAWLKCATFDTCKISATNGYQGMWISKSFWGVEGWEVTATGEYGTCFFISPPDSGGSEITHIVVANNVANGCTNYGIASNYVGGQTISPDYVAIIGNIIYNAASGGTAGCASGISILEPYQADTVAGTHILIDGNFSYQNLDPNPCDGTTPTDGEGIILDGLGAHGYAQQVAILNNLVMFNGSEGILNGGVGSSTAAPVYIDHNTSYSNVEDPNDTCCNFDVGEISIIAGTASITGTNTEASYNLAALPPTSPPGAGANTYGLSVVYGDGTSSADYNWTYGGPGAKNTVIYSSPGFSYGSHNVLGTNPNFSNPVAPGAPSCGGSTNTVNCMATVIANFTPTNSSAKAYGYQTPVSTPVTNSLFPTWLCNVGLPSGLVSTPCVPGNSTKLYTLPFAVTLPATIKAVGMWGQPNQPTSYPSGFGFVPSPVQTANYTTGGGVTLSSVSIAPTASQSNLTLGSTVQMIVTCHYSDGSTSGCNTTDANGNSVTSWVSSDGNVTVSSSGLATGAAIGTANISATVTGGFITSPAATLTVSANPATLSSVSLATSGAVSSIMVGATNQLIATCHYSDGSSTPCNTTDSHGNAVTSANSSVPSVASITSPGALATGVAAGSTNLSAAVIPAPAQLGTNLQNVSGFTNTGFINEIYGVTGTSAGNYTPGNCHIILPATTWVAGNLWTCLLVMGTPTTQNASALCSNSYTTTGTSWPGGDLIISMASCPALPPDQGYWVGSTTNQTTANPAQGFSNCNSACSGAPPVFGSGTYAYRYVANTFGNYTSLPTTLTPSAGTQQVSQYIELTTTPVTSANLPLSVTMPPPSLVSAYLTASSSSMIVGNTLQMAAKCHYTSGPDQDCTVADIHGDAVSAWVSSDPTRATVNNVGTSNPGLVTAVAAGTPSITANVGSVTSSAYPITVSNPAVTLTGVSLSLTGGITALFVGTTNQLKATCTYSDGSSDDCTTTDLHGNLAHNYVSTSPAHATVNATSGLVTGVALGTTTFTAVAGSFTSSALPLNVFPVLSGIYTITVSGPVKFSGTVRF